MASGKRLSVRTRTFPSVGVISRRFAAWSRCCSAVKRGVRRYDRVCGVFQPDLVPACCTSWSPDLEGAVMVRRVVHRLPAHALPEPEVSAVRRRSVCLRRAVTRAIANVFDAAAAGWASR